MDWVKLLDDIFVAYVPDDLARELRAQMPAWQRTAVHRRTLSLRAVTAPPSGATLRDLFAELWPAWRRWYLRDGDRARPTLDVCRRMLAEHMPELVPVWQRLVTEVAGGDRTAARFLAQYDPPAIVNNCSNVVVPGPEPALARNYDYDPDLFDGVVLNTRFGQRRVLGMSDQLWGLLDGVNDAGLAASLTFGGRPEVGSGFGIPIVLRYLLEVCRSVDDAVSVLRRIPIHASYNITLVDAGGAHATAFVGPGRTAAVTRERAITNHQEAVDWPSHARRFRSVERLDALSALLRRPDAGAAQIVAALLSPPLRATRYAAGFGTLYTAAYHPAEGRAEFSWPGSSWELSFDAFDETSRTARIPSSNASQA
jgi:predicted choloylglycine hydrolase